MNVCDIEIQSDQREKITQILTEAGFPAGVRRGITMKILIQP